MVRRLSWKEHLRLLDLHYPREGLEYVRLISLGKNQGRINVGDVVSTSNMQLSIIQEAVTFEVRKENRVRYVLLPSGGGLFLAVRCMLIILVVAILIFLRKGLSSLFSLL